MTTYGITDDGYYMRFPAEAVMPASALCAQPCEVTGHRDLAGCISIADAEQAGIVWLGYSDVQWTPALIKAHQGTAGKPLRELHMRAFDAGAWAAANQVTPGRPATTSDRGHVPHTVRMSALATTLAEYAPLSKVTQTLSRPFLPPCAPDFHARAGKAEATLSACLRRSPQLQGAIVVLDDPAAVAQDLAALIYWRRESLLDTRVSVGQFDKNGPYGSYATTYRDLATLDGEINLLHASNDEKVKMQVFSDDNYWVDVTLAQAPYAGAMQQKQVNESRIPAPDEIQRSQTDAWNDHLARLKKLPYEAWLKAFKQASDTLHQQHIAPLAQAHVAWMQSNLLANQFECTHDGRDALTGDVYAQTLQRCMAATQDIAGCNEVYLRWLKGDVTDPKNLLLRALLLRQDDPIKALAGAPLDPTNVPWQTLMDQYARQLQPLLKADINAKGKALAAQHAADQAKKIYDAAPVPSRLPALNPGGAAGLFDTPLESQLEVLNAANADAAKAAWEEAQHQADQATQDAAPKLLPDSVANLLMQIAAPLTTALRDYNSHAAEKTLARWMVIVGVALKAPVGVIEVTGKVRDTIKYLSSVMVNHLAETAVSKGKPLSEAQLRQLKTYAERQVKSSFASGIVASFNVATGKGVKSKMAVFITPEMTRLLETIPDPTQKIAWLVSNVKTPENLEQYGLLRVGQRLPQIGTVSEGALMLIDGLCKYAAWQQVLSDEATALSFQKTKALDMRESLGRWMFVGAVGAGAGQIVKTYGTWRNAYAVGMAEQQAGQRIAQLATKVLRVAGAVNAVVAGVMAAMDIADGMGNLTPEKWELARLQFLSGGLGMISAAIAFGAALAKDGTLLLGLSLNIWELLLAVVLVAVGMWLDHVKGDIFAQWLERTYWGALPAESRYSDAKTEQSDFTQAMAGV